MKRIINKKAYDTETAWCIATNDFSNGSNKFNCGRTSSLYRTKKGNYFVTHLTCWQGECNTLKPVSMNEAIAVYEEMGEEVEVFEVAFPGVDIEEA